MKDYFKKEGGDQKGKRKIDLRFKKVVMTKVVFQNWIKGGI